MLLCPSLCFTKSMSFVLWYVAVAFQCLKVWAWMFSNRGLFCDFAIIFLSLSRCRCAALAVGRGLLGCRAYVFINIETSFSDSFSSLLWLPFSGLIRTVFLSKSKSLNLSRATSPILAPVSFNSLSNVEWRIFLVALIRASISASNGTKGRDKSWTDTT